MLLTCISHCELSSSEYHDMSELHNCLPDATNISRLNKMLRCAILFRMFLCIKKPIVDQCHKVVENREFYTRQTFTTMMVIENYRVGQKNTGHLLIFVTCVCDVTPKIMILHSWWSPCPGHMPVLQPPRYHGSTDARSNPYINMFRTLSGVRMSVWISSQLDTLCTSAVKRYYAKVTIQQSCVICFTSYHSS